VWLVNSLTPVASLAESAHAFLIEEGASGVTRAAKALKVIFASNARAGWLRAELSRARPAACPGSATSFCHRLAGQWRSVVP
jgi:hypothetical protein